MNIRKTDAPAIVMVPDLFPPKFSGSTVQALRLSQGLKQKGARVEFLTDSGAETDAQEEYQGLVINKRRTRPGREDSSLTKLWWAVRITLFAIRHPRHRIFHFHTIFGPELLAFPLLRLLGRRIILKLSLVDSDDPVTLSNRRLLGGLYRQCFRSVDRMIAISPMLLQRALAVGVSRDRVALMPNGIDEGNYSLPTPEVRAAKRLALGLSPGDRVMVTVGSVEHRKGYDLLLQAYARISKELENCRLLIVGPENTTDNPFYCELQSFITANDLKGIEFLGRRSDIPDILKASDLFAFCSRQEGFPTVIIEAMACGTPLVAMDIDGITDWIIGQKQVSRNVASRDLEEFSEACITVLRDKNEEAIKNDAKATIEAYGMSRVAARYLQVYADIGVHGLT